MELSLPKPLVSVEWLAKNLEHPNVVILNATILKVTDKEEKLFHKNYQIKNARFFDIKNVFSDVSSNLSNTFPSKEQFQEEARKLGINSNSLIIVYDDYGFYSCARAWWLFKSFGHKNVAVLDGGIPLWIANKFAIEKVDDQHIKYGNFTAVYKEDYIKNYKDILNCIGNYDSLILDARAENRFSGEVEEPREGLRSGHIPSSKNIPYTKLVKNGKLLHDKELKLLFESIVENDKELIFTCGSGVTACILALGAEKIGYKNISIYDGSWTEWGSNHELPIQVGRN